MPLDIKKTYIIFNDVYVLEKYNAKEFIGTWRRLLEEVNGINEDNTEPFWIGPEEDDFKKTSDLTDNELVEFFNKANGDGQPYYVIWCVEDHKKVLG